MKNLLIALAVFVTATISAFSLSPIIVVTSANSGTNISVQVNNGGNEPIYTESFDDLEVNSSGLLVFQVGKNNQSWDSISAESVTTYHTVDVLQNGVVIAQYRLDYLIDLSARSGLGGGDSDLTTQEEVTFEGDVNIEGDNYVGGTSKLSSSFFDSLDSLAIRTTNILIYVGNALNGYDDIISSSDLNPDLPDGAIYYIVNRFSEGSALYFQAPNGREYAIQEEEFLILLKVNGNFYVINSENLP